MRKFLALLVLVGFTFFCICPQAYAGEIDILLQKLVEKGVISSGEAQEIKTETQEQVKSEIAQGKNNALPSWVQSIKLKGDFRTRIQTESLKGSNTNSGNSTDRTRARVRLRFGAEAKVNPQTKIHLGIATGSDGDPRSTNQTLQDDFSKKSIWLDYAYAEYSPKPWATLLMGRMKNPIWEPGDMLWDTDINPEGGAIKLTHKFSPTVEGYLNAGFFIIDEVSNSGDDPWVQIYQPGVKWKINDSVDLNAAVTAYAFGNLQEAGSWDWSASSNTRHNSQLKYNYNSISPAVELGINDPFKMIGCTFIPYLSLFGEYIHNPDPASSNNGYLGGIKLGHAKVAEKGQWQLKYMYVLLENDAWLDLFPDSDRYSGRTGIRSHEVILSYGLLKNVTLDFDYYYSTLTAAPASGVNANNRQQHLFQADFNFKF